MRQTNLPIDIIGRLLAYFSCSGEEVVLEEQIDFVARYYLERILGHEELKTQLAKHSALLACLIVKFSTHKCIAYFENQFLNLPIDHQRVRLSLPPGGADAIKARLKAWRCYNDANHAYQSGQQQFQKGRYANAIEAYTTALYLEACHPYSSYKTAKYYLARGWVKLLRGDYQGALEDVSQVALLHRFPSSKYKVNYMKKEYLARAWTYLLSMQQEEALEAINKVEELDSESSEVTCMKALIALQDGNLSGALAIAKYVVSLETQGTALFILAQLYRLKGENEAYQSALFSAQQAGDDKHLFDLLKKWIAAIGRSLIEKEESTAEITTLATSERIADSPYWGRLERGGPVEFCAQREGGSFSRCWAKLFCRDYQGAIDEASHGIAQYNEDYEGYLVRAWAYLFASNYELSEKDVAKVLTLEEGLKEVDCLIALHYLQEGALATALAIAKRVSEFEKMAPMGQGEEPIIMGYGTFITAHLYRLQNDERAYQAELAQAHAFGDRKGLFGLLEEWIMSVEKQLTERKEKTTETEAIEKSAMLTSPTQSLLVGYSAYELSFTPFNQHNDTQDKEDEEDYTETEKKLRHSIIN